MTYYTSAMPRERQSAFDAFCRLSGESVRPAPDPELEVLRRPASTGTRHAAAVQLEVFFDLSCPFCLLGKVRLDEVLREAVTPVNVTWSHLILHPAVPAEGTDFRLAHADRYGENSRRLQLYVERQAHDLGLVIDHSHIKKVPNTIDAHRAVRFAAESGSAGDIIEAILRAYLLEYRDIGDRRVLCDIVQSLGLNAREFRHRIGSDWQRAEVLASSQVARRDGAHSAPSYRLQGVYFENTADLLPELRRLTAR